MSTLELKELLKSKIDETNDDTILSLITSILENETESILSLSVAQKISIKKSQIEYLEGKFTHNDSFNSEIDSWLKE